MDLLWMLLLIGAVLALSSALMLEFPSSSSGSRWFWVLYLCPPLGLTIHAILAFRRQPVCSSLVLGGLAMIGVVLWMWAQ